MLMINLAVVLSLHDGYLSNPSDGKEAQNVEVPTQPSTRIFTTITDYVLSSTFHDVHFMSHSAVNSFQTKSRDSFLPYAIDMQ